MASSAIRSSHSPNGHKRKRGPTDQDIGRNSKAMNMNGDNSQGRSDEQYAALLQGIDQFQGQDENTRTAQAALATPLQSSQYPEPSPFDPPGMSTGFDDQGTPSQQASLGGGQGLYDPRQQSQQPPSKPSVGSHAWHQLRKDNHKEVERRRREVINEGIENIAKIVPGNEKNKGAILGRTCQYIQDLQKQIANFDNERALFSVTQQELTSRNDRLRDSAQRAWQETAKWQQRCKDANLPFDDYDTVNPGDELDQDQVDPNALTS